MAPMSDVARSKPRLNAVVVYDGDCAFCLRSVRWAERKLRRQPRYAAWQDVDLDSLGLTARECHDAVQWVDYRGKEAGARAVGRLLQAQGGLWRLVAWPPFLWPFSAVADALYRWVSRNRHRLPGGTAACEVPTTEDDAAAE
jgi:predicted DCC family thiol-disulfide oxidoreductase YuxK